MSGHTLLYQAPDGGVIEVRVPWTEGQMVPPDLINFMPMRGTDSSRTFRLVGADYNPIPTPRLDKRS